MGNLAQLQAASRSASPLIGQPLGEYAGIRDNAVATNLDELTLFGSGATGAFGDLLVGALTAPAAPTVTQGGTVGSTNYSYVVADLSNLGAAPSSATQTTTGNATLSATNYNIVQATGLVAGHTYGIYRSASSGTPSGTGLLATYTVPVVAPADASTTNLVNTYTINDTGQTATTADIPVNNTTGSANFAGPVGCATVFTGGNATGMGGLVVAASAIGLTLTTTQVLADILVRTGASGGAINDTLPTAAALVAAVGPGIKAGAIHRLEYRNECTGTNTIVTSTGITLRTGNTNTALTTTSRFFTFVFTNVTPGSEAIQVITGPASAY